jgi:hypothetical protein
MQPGRLGKKGAGGFIPPRRAGQEGCGVLHRKRVRRRTIPRDQNCAGNVQGQCRPHFRSGLPVVCDYGGRHASAAHTLACETRDDSVAWCLPAPVREKLEKNNTGIDWASFYLMYVEFGHGLDSSSVLVIACMLCSFRCHYMVCIGTSYIATRIGVTYMELVLFYVGFLETIVVGQLIGFPEI